MSTRTWDSGDPEPADRPAVVDDEGFTWLWTDMADEDYPVWTRMQLTRHPGGAVVGCRTAYDWTEMLDEYGPLREAAAAEADRMTITFPAGKP